MKIRYLFLVYVLSLKYYGQQNTYTPAPYSYCTWENMSLSKNYVSDETDSCLFVVSTRNFDSTKKQFFDFDFDTSRTLKYFAVYFKGDNWTAVQHPNLTALLETKQKFEDMVIFTEGLGKTFTSGVDRATKLLRIYGIDEIFFDWPTLHPELKRIKNFRAASKISDDVATCYAAFFKEFESYKKTHIFKFKHTTLFFHSMGNLLIMHDMKRNFLKDVSTHIVDNLILNAACVPQRKHARWVKKINFADDIYITINKKDRNLKGAKLLTLKHQLGEKVRKPRCKNVNYVDFTNVLNNDHNYYLVRTLLAEKPYLKKFYSDIFHGTIPLKQYQKLN